MLLSSSLWLVVYLPVPLAPLFWNLHTIDGKLIDSLPTQLYSNSCEQICNSKPLK